MTPESWMTLGILGSTLLAMVWGILRLDILALLMLLALGLSGILNVSELLSGFSDPVVFSITALFVVGKAIQTSGLAQSMGQGIIHLTGERERPLRIALILAVALLSGLMSSTGTLSIFLPIALALAHQLKVHPGRFLMPMAFAAFVGGMLTLIGTPPNLVVNNTLKAAELTPFGFFSFSGAGLLALAVLIAYFIGLEKFLLPQTPWQKSGSPRALNLRELMQNYALEGLWKWYRIPTGQSQWTRLPLGEMKLPTNLQCLCVQKANRPHQLQWCDHTTTFAPGDRVLIQSDADTEAELIQNHQLTAVDLKNLPHQLETHQQGVAELMILPRSDLVGKTLTEINFRNRYHLHITQIVRRGAVIQNHLAHEVLRFADILLVQGKQEHLKAIKQSAQLLLLNPTTFDTPLDFKKMGRTAFWIVLMLLLLTLSALPMALVILGTVLGLIISRCLSMEEAYRSISWDTIILIAAMLPMAQALEKVGVMHVFVAELTQALQGLPLMGTLALLFALTSGLSLILSNTATTVLMAPVALQLAQHLQASPHAFLMVVALAASSAFASPLASPVNLMVMSQGNYRFKDYVKVGLPLQLLFLCVLVVAVRGFFP